MSSRSRRDFLKSSVLGLAGSSVLAGSKKNEAIANSTSRAIINEPDR
jgi:hypothetical protein